MRSDFNIVIVDDLFADEDDRGIIDSYISYLKNIINSKGFNPKFSEYKSSSEVLQEIDVQERKRIDLYISDNNLGDDSEGIDLYLRLKTDFICDFILYTQSGVDGIINKLKNDLDVNKNPNLFSRFTFVSRQNDNTWKSISQDIIKHIITKREEFNNLRGLFAQVTARIHTHLANKVLPTGTEKKFSSTIEDAYSQKILSEICRKQLHEIRLIRNALMHEDEIKCSQTDKYYIKYQTPRLTPYKVFDDGGMQTLYEDGNFQQLRQKLKSLSSQVLAL